MAQPQHAVPATPPAPAVVPLSASAANRAADRDCSRTDGKNTQPRSRSKSHARLPKAPAPSNPRLPRAQSAANGLPRGRSFQGSKPLTAAAQAAQDGYYHRKAAKMYAEKRKAAAAAAQAQAHAHAQAHPDAPQAPDDKDKKPVGVINITVDHHGVKIDDGKPHRPMGPRRNSRPRMSRSNSRRANPSPRPDDKENVAERALDDHIEAYFTKKRGAAEPDRRTVRETPGENTSWDGSMPKRQNSRSFLERNPPPDTTKTNPQSDAATSTATSKPNQPAAEAAQDHIHRSKKKGAKNKSADTHPKLSETPKPDTSATPHAGANSDEGDTQPAPVKRDTERAPSISDVSETDGASNTSQSASPVKEEQPVHNRSSPQPKDTESQSSGSSYKSTLSNPVSHTSEATSSTDFGKWCDQCAGVGLHIAALLSELQKHPVPELGADAASSGSAPAKKASWKSMVTQTVLGDSKSKSSSEKARLQSENAVLRATVDFLYKKIEHLEGAGATAAASPAAQ